MARKYEGKTKKKRGEIVHCQTPLYRSMIEDLKEATGEKTSKGALTKAVGEYLMKHHPKYSGKKK